jgi:hypothetical protein
MIVPIDKQPANLNENPVIRQRLGPCGIDRETRRLAGLRGVIYARFLHQPFERAVVGVGAPARERQ